ncbi:hypothetical protein [Hydrogenophaga sp.]|uniref:hypothetical protein n=1 Tax=Hydrogenophaga sp. TaxID=1904254 RepID=UPI0025C01093|nr:hypothetical protein [Hydrogenophaga sp.]MBT9462540.1 hypothetical protein [Hydrogenophaga sp.]
MSKTITQAIKGAQIGAVSAQPEDLQAGVKGLFMLFHAWYGTLLLSRYTTGDVDAEGKDRGIKSAMVVWQHELDGFDGDVVRAAAERCKVDHSKYPPTLPEFVALCKAIQPRRPAPESQFKIPMSEGLRSSYTARARTEAMATYNARISVCMGMVKPGEGLDTVRALIAEAVRLAGGDEVATLRRLESKVSPPERSPAAVPAREFSAMKGKR